MMLHSTLNGSTSTQSSESAVSSFPKTMDAIVLLIILFFGCNIVDAQESNLQNPESKIVKTIDFIQASLNKGPMCVEADVKSSESNIKERIDFIQASFDKGQTRARLWSYSWTAVYGVATGIQTYQAMSSRHDRVSNIVAASESFMGVAALMIDPFHARSSGSELREIPGTTPEEQKNKLEQAEKWLERNYKQEKLGRSWLTHLGVLVVGVIGGGIVWHYEGRNHALINGLSAIAGGELLIWTQPTKAIEDYHAYHSKYKDAYDGIPEKKYFITPSKNGFVAGAYF